MTTPEKLVPFAPSEASDDAWPTTLNWQYGPVPPVRAWVPEEVYHDIVEQMPLVCVDTLVVRGDHVLLTRRRQEPQAGELWVQGGRLRKGERLEDAALRTAQGESGLRLALRALLGTFSTTFDTSAHGSSTTHTVNVTFLGCADIDAEPRLDSAHDSFVWWPLGEPTGNSYIDQLVTLAKTHLKEQER